MSSFSRRDMLKSSAALVGLAAIHSKSGRVAAVSGAPKMGRLGLATEVGKADPVATDVYFHETNLATNGSNNGWVVFEDYVLVIDASFPSGAQAILGKTRSI